MLKKQKNYITNIQKFMKKINYVEGDLIELALMGKFDVIGHGCNCLSTMGSGIAVPMKNTFGCDKFPMEKQKIGILKLGNIDAKNFIIDEKKKLTVINCYTQYSVRTKDNPRPLDYDALRLCMRKINHQYKGLHIGLPKIGSERAGGDWNIIEQIIKEELIECNTTIVIYNK